MNKGIVAINKPAGWTSFDVVNKLKHILGTTKVGHLGTLDPMATGVLLVTVGKATKLFDLMQEKQKKYLAKFEFGYETDTLDSTGKIINSSSNIPNKQQIIDILPSFLGKIAQIPPKYSAKSVNGVRAYTLVRQDKVFKLDAKVVEIFDIKLIEYSNKMLTLEITCGSGTYIRAIGRDIAYKLNTSATMTELTRTQVGSFSLKDCQNINELNSTNIKIHPIEEILNYPILKLSDLQTHKLLNGQTLNLAYADGNYILMEGQESVAIVKISKNLAKMSIFLG